MGVYPGIVGPFPKVNLDGSSGKGREVETGTMPAPFEIFTLGEGVFTATGVDLRLKIVIVISNVSTVSSATTIIKRKLGKSFLARIAALRYRLLTCCTEGNTSVILVIAL
jgi:hypothetical protein